MEKLLSTTETQGGSNAKNLTGQHTKNIFISCNGYENIFYHTTTNNLIQDVLS